MAQLTVVEAAKLAMDYQASGRLAEAESVYRQILAQQPDNVDALHYLGLVAHQRGDAARARDLIARSIALAPRAAHFHNNLGKVLRHGGDLPASIASYRRALELDPVNADAHNNLGVALAASGAAEEAVASYRRSLELRPGVATTHYNLGLVLLKQGKLDAAIAAFHQALVLDPNLADAHTQLSAAFAGQGRLDQAVTAARRAVTAGPESADAFQGLARALLAQQRTDEAIEACRSALSCKPGSADAIALLGIGLQAKGSLEEALPVCRAAVALDPSSAAAHCALGRTLADLGEAEEAASVLGRAIELEPRAPDAYNALGSVVQRQGRVREAIELYERCLAVRPDHAPAYWNKSLALLSLGDFPQGWAEYEWRWHCRDLVPSPRHFRQPRWDGSPLGGRTVLLHAEQGFGDTIQFVRFAPLAAAAGGKVILECPRELARLLESVPGVAQVVTAGDPLPEFHVHLPLMSCPLIFGTTLPTIPATVPYLAVPASRQRAWVARLGPGDGLRVGLAWAGRPQHRNDRDRSIPLRELAPLGRVPGVRLYSLQIGAGSRELVEEGSLGAMNLTADITDFADTAALVGTLDLVIAVDTAVAHLAGALGKPAWVLVAAAADWRWLLDRDDSPWYPTVRLFRQDAARAWGPVVARVATALGRTVDAREGRAE